MSAGRCATRWPILLVHGSHLRDDCAGGSWGPIPARLEREGARVYFGGQDAWGSIEENAAVLVRRVEEVLGPESDAKVNLIAHSKGGLDCRWAISQLGLAGRVASLTTISTPHNGLGMMDALSRLPSPLYRAVSTGVDFDARHRGDGGPDFYAASRRFARPACAGLNEALPDAEGVFYRAFVSVCNLPHSRVFWPTALLLTLCDGANDGLVSFDSCCRWETRLLRRPLDHVQVVGLRSTPADLEWVCHFYAALVRDLKRRGL